MSGALGIMVRHQGPKSNEANRRSRPKAVLYGPLYMSEHFQKEIAFLFIACSPAFVRARGNGCVERLIRTLKENLLWVQHFEIIDEQRQALLEFRETYNVTWLIERHGFISPADYRRQQLQQTAKAT